MSRASLPVALLSVHIAWALAAPGQAQTVARVGALSAPGEGYDGAPYTLDHVVALFGYPEYQGRPTLVFDGSSLPSRAARAAPARATPARASLAATPARPPTASADLAVPEPRFVCATDDVVGEASGDAGAGDEDGLDLAYRQALQSTTSARRLAVAGPAMSPRSLQKDLGIPEVSRWPEIVDCPADREHQIREAWQHAHDQVWVAKAMIDFIDVTFPEWRPLLWSHGYDSKLDDAGNGTSSDVTAANWSPRAWFGSYDGDRLNRVRKVVDDLWWRFRNEKIRLDCDLSPGVQGDMGVIDEDTWSACHQSNPGGGGGGPSAYHFPEGKIALCRPFFDWGGDPDYATRWYAKELVHEMSHYLKWRDSPVGFAKDAHTISCKGHGGSAAAICHTIGDKMYGSSDAVHLATKHADHAYRNIDNYAYFVYRVGRSVLEGHLKWFPSSWEGFPPPPWSPPNPSDNVCSILADDIPGNDPGLDVCEGLKGQSFDDCKGSVEGKLPPLCR